MKKSENIIGINIKSRRGILGLTQDELANKVGCHQKDISGWESGITPSAKNLQKIAEALKVSPEWLLIEQKDNSDSDTQPLTKRDIEDIKIQHEEIKEVLMAILKAVNSGLVKRPYAEPGSPAADSK